MKPREVTVRILSWLAEKADKGAAGTLEYKFILKKGDTVADILQRLAVEIPQLILIIPDTNQMVLQPNIGVILNNRLLDLAGGYNGALKDGDILEIYPAYIDG